MVVPRGNAPRSSGYQPDALLLSYGTVCFRLSLANHLLHSGQVHKRRFRIRKFPCLMFWAILIVLPVRSAELKYQGKSLTQWLKLYQNADNDSLGEQRAALAVRSIGTNALPLLTKWVASDDLDEQFLAKNGFQILGTTAHPAVQPLGKMLVSTNDLISLTAAQCLGYIGTPALPELLAGLTNRQFKVGTAAALAIVELGTNASPAVPILIRQLQHPNHFYRERAADALGKLGIEPKTVVPALTALLKDESQAARYLSIRGLEGFDSSARPAVPALTELLNDPEEGVREAATNAIHKIAPELLTKAPSH
jgi:HEAT repeat protein